MPPVVVFDGVSKKFQRGERHTSLRDLIPSMTRRALDFRRRPVLGANEFWALENVSFEVEKGTALGIIGANGAGKSTTLKILTRILRPTLGTSATFGRVGALIEVASGFHPDLTGRENVFLQGAIMGMKRTEIARQLDSIIDFAGVSDHMETPVKRYSSGMNARLGFSIAAHLDPDVLVIDEVLSVGDMAFQQKCFDRMLEFKQQGAAIVLVSHNLQAVSWLCDHGLYLDRRPVAFGRATEVIDAYLTRTGAHDTALTSTNLMVTDVQLTAGDGGRALDVAPGSALQLSLTVTTQERFDHFIFYFRIRRSTDQLLAYDGHVTGDEAGCPVLMAHQPMRLEFAFSANLTRGHYYLELQIYHKPTQSFLLKMSPAGSFVVDELRTHAGIADVHLRVHSRASPTI